PGIASNIVKFRKENGLFKRREELTKVPNFNSKSYEQAVGFLRVPGGEVALDATGVHPESYTAVKDMAKELNANVSELMGPGAKKILDLKEKWSGLIGEFTFKDIVDELSKPGRDPRDPFKVFQFRDDIFSVDDLKEGMICNGIVSNVTNFGAFVDIGVHQDGLVHISEMANQFVDDTQKMFSPGDQVQVKVKSVDKDKMQIGLTMKISDEKSPSKAGGKKRVSMKPKDGGKGKKGGKGNKRPQGGKGGQKPRRPSQPFNNPFAALTDLKK
ncbi:MAG: S1 RNA-binding domain-containing protein, partial [Bdellovibrionales bacterium]|nr:S1 RNA-binding domain-containing protein [Bdellovibrionales bacterium]NQZ20282.1 S1 RNA-binding domain-containing protein [Bdellovibrionales bacterium]